jgi:hypothetical protein
MHLKYISKSFKKSLFEQMYSEYPQYKDVKRKKSNLFSFNTFYIKSKSKEDKTHKKRKRSSSSENDRKIFF